ncbi:MAG TPA: hypothetical protein VLG27_03700 [Candidatus Saccharimonadia bacterium]|nr:hypothetical protein [Candidatus Saccharimonadia bacterium]
MIGHDMRIREQEASEEASALAHTQTKERLRQPFNDLKASNSAALSVVRELTSGRQKWQTNINRYGDGQLYPVEVQSFPVVLERAPKTALTPNYFAVCVGSNVQSPSGRAIFGFARFTFALVPEGRVPEFIESDRYPLALLGDPKAITRTKDYLSENAIDHISDRAWRLEGNGLFWRRAYNRLLKETANEVHQFEHDVAWISEAVADTHLNPHLYPKPDIV